MGCRPGVDADVELELELGAEELSSPSTFTVGEFDEEVEEVDSCNFHNILDIVAVVVAEQEVEEQAFLLQEVVVVMAVEFRNLPESSKDHLLNLLLHFSYHLLHPPSRLK